MSASNYDIDKELFLKAKGRFVKASNYAKGTDIRMIVKSLVTLYNDINGHYASSVADDGKIIGTERSILVEKSDILIQLIILCIRYFTNEKSLNLTADSDIAPPLILVMEHDEWILSGMLPRSLPDFDGTLARFFQEILSKELKAFFEKFKSTSLDGELKLSEKEELIFKLKDILLGSIKMYYLLYHMKINN